MRVLKFGGTSVGTVTSLTNVRKICQEIEGKGIVVVSALGGVTDMLISAANMAVSADKQWEGIYSNIVARHNDVISGLVPTDKVKETSDSISKLLNELHSIYHGLELTKDLSERTLCSIVSFGERMSSIIVAAIIPGAKKFDSLQFIKTEKWFNRNIADITLSSSLIKKIFNTNDWNLAIVPGFISTDRDNGDITNLGRGGSDYTAAIIAAALDAKVLEIWTDVDGFMTADPRIIPEAYVIDRLSFIESMELCNYGAKVIYPPTIHPVFHKNIPIVIKNTFNPSAPGTWISDQHTPGNKPLKGVSAIDGTTLLSLSFTNKSNNASALHSRILNALTKNGVNILLTTRNDKDSEYISVAVRCIDAQNASAAIRDEFATELYTGELRDIESCNELATVALVGEKIKLSQGISARLFNTLERNNITVIADSTDASELSISFIVNSSELHEALSLVHETFFNQRH